ncbi:DoxX family protein [Rhodococcus sp. NPDC059968]|uniref:DoxX family protein n=1 Tax=Rhodococcus sp. NPDC059968 TaxID=3347017 RepID=UPI00366FED8A
MVSDTAVSAGILLLRVVVGFVIAAHGYNKFFGGGRIPGTAGWFDSIGMRPGLLHARLAATTEIGSGILLAMGLLTPLAGAAIVALMLVAGYTVHRGSGFFVNANGWEYNVVLAVVGVSVSITGAGRWSIDNLVGIDHTLSGWLGFAISVVLGLIAGIAQLALFFRPSATAGR